MAGVHLWDLCLVLKQSGTYGPSPFSRARTHTGTRTPTSLHARAWGRTSGYGTHAEAEQWRSAALIATDHILSDTLQTDRGVGDQGQAPELLVVLAEVVSREDRRRALRGSHRVGSADRRMRAIDISGLDFHVADAFLPCEPVFTSKQGGVGVGEGTAGRDQSQSKESRVHDFALDSF